MNNEMFLPFALPDIGDEEINEVVDSMKSGWLTTGQKTARFENDFAEYMQNKICAIAVNSATAGLHLAAEAIGIGPGDEVITTPYTFTATAEVVRYLGADVVFADIDPKTYCIDPQKIEEAITDRTKAIFPVHYAGLSCDMDKIIDIASRYNLKIVEDAAHALPTTYKGKLIGTLDTDATVFSFYVTKTLAVGEGGMVTSRNKEIIKRCSIMRLHGIDRDSFSQDALKKPAWYYEVVATGYKYNMTDITASIGLHQLKKLNALQQKRQKINVYYNYRFKDLPVILPPDPREGDIHARHLYPLQIMDDARVDRDRFINMMYEENIGTSVHFIPLHIHPYWKDKYNLKPDDFPYSYSLFNHEVSLPIYTKMTDSDVERTANTICRILG